MARWRALDPLPESIGFHISAMDFFSFPASNNVCISGEREAQTCVDRVQLLGKSTYLEGEQCLTRNKASVSTWLIPSWASLCHCFVPALDQRFMWKLVEVKHYQKLQPSSAAEENKILARWVWEPRLLWRAGDTSQGSREKQALTLQCHRTAETICLSKPLGKAFPKALESFFFSWLGKKLKVIISYSQALPSKLDSYVKASSIFRLHDCTLSKINMGGFLNFSEV